MTNTDRDYLNPPIQIDTHAAQPARITDYLLGGQANFPVDRDVIEYIAAVLPGGTDAARATTRASQSFQARAVRYLVGEAGIRQLLYGGARLPNGVKVHKLAQEIAPECRVVYVIDDDVTMAHAHTLLASTPEGASAYVRARLDDSERIVGDAADTLDFTQPVAVMLQGGLHQIADDATARRLVSRLLDETVAGSYLTMSHLTADLLGDEIAPAIHRLEQMVGESKMVSLTLRSQAQVAALFDDLDLVEPGVVPVDEWRPDESVADSSSTANSLLYGAVGRKP